MNTQCEFQYVEDQDHCYVCKTCGAEIIDESIPAKAREFPALYCAKPSLRQRVMRWSLGQLDGAHSAIS
jgi:hypothetical protein